MDDSANRLEEDPFKSMQKKSGAPDEGEPGAKKGSFDKDQPKP